MAYRCFSNAVSSPGAAREGYGGVRPYFIPRWVSRATDSNKARTTSAERRGSAEGLHDHPSTLLRAEWRGLVRGAVQVGHVCYCQSWVSGWVVALAPRGGSW